MSWVIGYSLLVLRVVVFIVVAVDFKGVNKIAALEQRGPFIAFRIVKEHEPWETAGELMVIQCS